MTVSRNIPVFLNAYIMQSDDKKTVFISNGGERISK